MAGETIDLVALAIEVCNRYRQEFPDEQQRYGEAGEAWCRHDNQHLVNWALLDIKHSLGILDKNVAWLGRILAARGFPLERLRRDLEIAAEVCGERLPHIAELPARLRAAVTAVPPPDS